MKSELLKRCNMASRVRVDERRMPAHLHKQRWKGVKRFAGERQALVSMPPGIPVARLALVMCPTTGHPPSHRLLAAAPPPVQLLGCATLFMTAQLLKVLFAKMLSSKFNQAAHYAKMHLALKRVSSGCLPFSPSTPTAHACLGAPIRLAFAVHMHTPRQPRRHCVAAACSTHTIPLCPVQEYLLHMLLQPRQRYTQLEELEGEEYEEGGDGGDDGGLGERGRLACDSCSTAFARACCDDI